MAKESSSGSAKKEKNKSSLRVLKSLAKKSKVQKDNPFESISSRRKIQYIEEKTKGRGTRTRWTLSVSLRAKEAEDAAKGVRAEYKVLSLCRYANWRAK